MKRRLIVALGAGATDQQHTAFTSYLKLTFPNAGWWHRLPNTWLLIDLTGSMTAVAIRDAVLTIFPNVHCLVLEFRQDGTSTWAGFGPSAGILDMFGWINEQWS